MKDCELTLCQAIERHINNYPLRFHMPGHKGKNIIDLKNPFEIDLTELHGLDNLHFPEGCISSSEKLTAELFGAGESFFLVNGSSAGIIASVLALTADGGSAVCARNCHGSTFKGLCLSGARPVYVMPEMLDCGICGGIDPAKLEMALKNAENPRAVFIVSPTFEGFTSDIKKIAEITHKYNAVLVVDEAHGAHFKFGKDFPVTALEQGADISVQSWHKTLSALGQGSVLHTGGNNIDMEKLKFYLSVMQTTSPSYAIMASLDATRQLLTNHGTSLFEKYEHSLSHLRERLSHLKSIRLISDEIIGKSAVSDYDKGKLTLYLKGKGKKLEAFLMEKGIFIEMASFDHAILMTSFADSNEDYNTLFSALSEFDTSQTENASPQDYLPAGISYRIPKMAYTPAESLKRRAKSIPAGEAVGRISAGFITPYPPGIPLVVPGEIITEEAVLLCQSKNRHKIEINGLLNDKYLSVLE